MRCSLNTFQEGTHSNFKEEQQEAQGCDKQGRAVPGGVCSIWKMPCMRATFSVSKALAACWAWWQSLLLASLQSTTCKSPPLLLSCKCGLELCSGHSTSIVELLAVSHTAHSRLVHGHIVMSAFTYFLQLCNTNSLHGAIGQQENLAWRHCLLYVQGFDAWESFICLTV